jgi:hypothetical protein
MTAVFQIINILSNKYIILYLILTAYMKQI